MSLMSQTTIPSLGVSKKQIGFVLLFVIAIYMIVPQLGAFKSSWRLILSPDPVWVVLAVAFTALTYFSGALTYCLLAFRRLQYTEVVLVQFAAMFINRLLPAGVGALGANYLYLRHTKHSSTQAGSMVAINNLLGTVGHGTLVAVALLAYSGEISIGLGDKKLVSLVAKVGIVLVLVAAVLLIVFGKDKLRRTALDLKKQLLSYRRRPWDLLAALLSSMTLTVFNVLCLAACANALSAHLPFVIILLIFSFGVGAGTATPTPGGLGGFEAGLVAGFVAYHIASPTALAVALLYRFISYWLPLVIGGIAFIVCQQKRLFAPR